jgi:hypothetical protein
MKEHPILFSTDMVRAVLQGRKTQTRRVIRPQKNITDMAVAYQAGDGSWIFWDSDSPDLAESTKRRYPSGGFKCPFGIPGDGLWVRETWTFWEDPNNGQDFVKYRAGGKKRFPNIHDLKYSGWAFDGKWRPSIHMPRWASRITLEVVSVRVERVQEITEEDAKAEGCEIGHGLDDSSPFFAKGAFRNLWDSLNAKRGYGWDKNPWVWVVEFKLDGQAWGRAGG